MSANDEFLEALLGLHAGSGAVDRKVLARLLMQAARAIDAERTATAAGVAPLDPRMEELRRVLMSAEIAQLAKLSRQIEDPEQFAAAISKVLPNAIALAENRDQRLGQVLAPTVERAAQTSIRSNPGALAGIMQPVLLPAIRKSIGEAIDGTFQSLNESLKASLTWRGLRWRFQAWRAGKTYAEVVLQHTLVYQVEHAFLIHRHSGLLIAHAASDTAQSQDPQLVSSMLSAIQDFVRDSFSGDGPGRDLDAIRLGDLLVWTEQGPHATLVAVIRGKPPEALHDTLRTTLAQIHETHPHSLEHFDGDSTPFAAVDVSVKALVGLRQEARQQKRGFPWLLLLVVLALIGLAVWWFLEWRGEQQRWQRYVQRLHDAPGIVVTGVEKRDGKWHLNGMRDPLAVDPAMLIDGTGVDPARVVAHWQPYLALDLPFTAQRLRSSLDPPPTVTLELEGDRIVGRGAASRPWLQKARAQVAALPLGSPTVDLASIRDINEGELGRLTAAIQSHAILFDPGEALPSAGQDLTFDRIVRQLQDLVELSSRLRVTTRVVLTGHSDATGKGASNLSLSVARSEAVRSYLIRQRGVTPSLLAVRGAGMLEPLKDEASETDRSQNRRVSLSVVIDE